MKRFLHAIALFFLLSAVFLAWEVLVSLYSQADRVTLLRGTLLRSLIFDFALFLLLKNTLYFRLFLASSPTYSPRRLPLHITFVVLFSAIYWSVFFAVAVALGSRRFPVSALFAVFAAIFLLAILVYDLFFRRRITYRNFVIDRRRIASLLLILFLGVFLLALRRERYYVQPFINTVPVVPHRTYPIEYDEQSGVYTLTAPDDDFRILHLTDVHLGGSLFSYSKDIAALKACFAEIAATRPDLVIVTGDLSLPLGILSMSFNNSAPVYAFASFMRNIGIPWAFAYGNHDTESFASMNKRDIDALYRSLSFRTSGNLLYPYVQPAVTGRNNQLICVRNGDGSLRQALFLLDSNAYTGRGWNDYDYIHDDQVAWYRGEVSWLCREEGRTVPSLAFFHIPLQEYRTAYELYRIGSPAVTYHFGANEEKMIAKVCCSDHPSTLFDAMVELGSTTGTFCGHDHYNNMSLTYRGIRLTYGMSIDYLAMPGISRDTRQRGGELITLSREGSWSVEQVPLEGIPASIRL